MSNRTRVIPLLSTALAACLAVVMLPAGEVHAAEEEVSSQFAELDDYRTDPGVQIVGNGDFQDIHVIGPGEAPPVPARAGGGTCTAPAGIQVTCEDGTGYIVTKGPISQMTLGYTWSTAWHSGSNANVIGRGFEYGQEVWRGGGNATSGSFSVPWYGAGYTDPISGWEVEYTEIMSVKKVKVRSMSPPAGVTVNWS